MIKKARLLFESWAQEGTRPMMYNLEQVASGEYISPFTEYAWRAFLAGYGRQSREGR